MKHLWSLLILLLTGCSMITPQISPSPTAIPTATPRPTATATNTPQPEHGLLTLTLWVPEFLDPYAEDSGAAILDTQIVTFSQTHPDVQTQIIVKKGRGPGGLYNLLSTAYEAAPSVLPDVIVLETTDLQAAIKGGFVQPLDASRGDEETYFSFALQGIADDQAIYGIPYLAQGDLMLYRKGLSATPPLSWTTVLTAGYAMLFPAAPPNGIADDALLAIYLGTGGATANEDGNPTLERVHLEEMYRFFSRMVETHLLDPTMAMELPDAAACAEKYRAGIAWLSPIPFTTYWTGPWPRSRPTWAPTPNGKATGIVHTWSLAIVASDPTRKQAALHLAQWLTAPEQMAALTQAVGLWPARFQAIKLWDTMPEETAFLETFLGNATPSLPTTVDEPVRKALQAGLTALLSGEVDTPEDAADYALTVLNK